MAAQKTLQSAQDRDFMYMMIMLALLLAGCGDQAFDDGEHDVGGSSDFGPPQEQLVEEARLLEEGLAEGASYGEVDDGIPTDPMPPVGVTECLDLEYPSGTICNGPIDGPVAK